jgi:hypothetical protein
VLGVVVSWIKDKPKDDRDAHLKILKIIELLTEAN